MAISLPKSAPKKVGRYRLLAPIARGGAATVYLGRSEGLGGFARIVAVKLLHPHLLEDGSSQAANEFIEEAKLSARMQHPMIVPVMDVGQSEDGFYLVMDYIDGASLSEVIHHTNLLPARIGLRILYDALSGLQAAHTAKDERGRELGIVHRDFSPQNILVGTDGRSRLTDFGIARATTRAEYTRTGLVKGKVAYMSPEQAEGKPLDARTDVWAAGVVAWELFAGRRMYPKMDPMPMMLRIINDKPPSLKSVKPTVPPALSAALARALARNIENRCSTALELRDSILQALGGESQMASAEEVGEFVVGLKLERLDELRAIVQETSESHSVQPHADSSPGKREDEHPTVVEARGSADASGTFATTSAERGAAAGETAEMVGRLQKWNGSWLAVAGAFTIVAAGAFYFLSRSENPPNRVTPERSAATLQENDAKVASANPPSDSNKSDEKSPADEEELALPGEPEPDPRTEVRFTSQSPFQSLKIGSRSISLPSPTVDVSVRLLEKERFHAFDVQAVTQDGRVAKGRVSATDTEMALEFSKAPAPTVRRSGPTPKPHAATRNSGLAESPY